MATFDEIIEKYKIEDQATPAINKMKDATDRLAQAAHQARSAVASAFQQANQSSHQYASIANSAGGGRGGYGGGNPVGGMFSMFANLGAAAEAGLMGVLVVVGAVVGSIIGQVAAMVGNVIGQIISLAARASQAILGILEHAVNIAAQFQQVQMTLQALSGSAEVAAGKMKWLKQFALESAAQFKDLAEASTILEAGGLRIERLMPTISNIATAFGATREKIIELSEAFVRLTSGQFGESERIFRRFGINIGDLMAQGIKVSGTGQIISPVMEVFQAIENVAKKKFGQIGELMKDTIVVKLSNLQDAWDQMLASWGSGTFPFLNKVMDSLQSIMQFLSNSEILNGIAEKLGGVFSKFSEEGGLFDMLARGVFTFVAVLENLPQVFTNVFSQVLTFMRSSADSLRDMWNGIVTQVVGAVNMIHDAFDSFKHIPGLHFNPSTPKMDVNKYLIGKPDKPETNQEMMARLQDNFTKNYLGENTTNRAGELMKMYQDIKGQVSNAAATQPTGSFLNGNSAINEIAKNTHKIAVNTEKQLDFKKYILGGGSLAQGGMGISPVDSVSRGSASGQTLNVRLHGATSFADVVQETLLAMGHQNFSIGNGSQ